MKKLKEKFKNKPVLPKIIKKKKIGRWCEYYDGRLPFPIECSNNKKSPISVVFKDGKKTITRKTTKCKNCKRSPSFTAWKNGKWDRIITAIERGDDLTDMKSPEENE